MVRASVWVTAAAAIGSAAISGCRQPPPPPPPMAPPPPRMSPAQVKSADVKRLDDALARFDDNVERMPGHTQEDHRSAAAGALSALADALRAAHGTGTISPAYTSDLDIVTAAAATVAKPDVPRERMAAAENQAFHAATSALRTVSTRVLFDDAELPPLVDGSADKADAARQQLGPLHDADATDAFRAIQLTLHRVDADLRKRFAGGPPVPMSDRPATPASMPAEAPPAPAATMPGM